MRVALRLLAGWLLLLVAVPGLAQAADPALVLAAADLRLGQSLDGEWRYSIDPFRTGQTGFHGGAVGRGQRRGDDIDVKAASAAEPRALFEYDLDNAPAVRLPGAWVGHEPAMRHYAGLVWYQRRFDAVLTAGQRQFLRFGAIDYAAEVWLNGKLIGRHEGGFTPFAIEVTGQLRNSANRLVIGVDSQRNAASIPPPITDWEDYGGITQPVTLLTVAETFVDDGWVRLTRVGRIAVDVRLNGPAKAGQPIELVIAELGLRLSGKTDAQGRWQGDVKAPIRLRRWSPEQPKLYDVAIHAGQDVWRDRVGFRTIATAGSKLLLNGKPIFLRGISLHGEELGASPVRKITPDAAAVLLGEIKQGLGGNFVRLAHYPHSEAMLRAADRMGLLVWGEIPVYWQVAFADPAALGAARGMLAEMIRRDRNRAAVVIWSVGNETPLSEARNGFMAQLADDARALDPERLISAALLTDRDGRRITLADPLAAKLDVLAVNTYNGWYSDDRLADLPQLIWAVTPDKPLLISEFGADAKAGLHDATVPAGAEPHKFSEEFQAEYYRQTLAMLNRIPTLAGMSPWILKDFRSPRRQRSGIQDGWNRKGLISETGQRKAAFGVLADYYRQQAAAE